MTILVQNKHLLNLSLEQEVTVIILPTDISQYTLSSLYFAQKSNSILLVINGLFSASSFDNFAFFFLGKKVFSDSCSFSNHFVAKSLNLCFFLFCNNLVKQINLEKAFWFIQLKKNYLIAANSERLNYYCYCQVINYMAPK